MKTVTLYGFLAKRFGRHHRMDVRTPAEAARALEANLPGFRQAVIGYEAGYHVRVGKEYRDEQTVNLSADSDHIKIIPAVMGSGSFGKIILGAALFFAAPYAAGWLFANTAAVGLAVAVANVLPAIGIALALGGVAQMLFKPPKSQVVERPESKPSYAFDGPVNTTAQGNPVSICYGRLMVGSQVISAKLTSKDIPV